MEGFGKRDLSYLKAGIRDFKQRGGGGGVVRGGGGGGGVGGGGGGGGERLGTPKNVCVGG